MKKLFPLATAKTLAVLCITALLHAGLHASTKTIPVDPGVTVVQPSTILTLGKRTDTLAAIREVAALIVQPMTKLSLAARWAFAEILSKWVSERSEAINADLLILINSAINSPVSIFIPIQQNFIVTRILPLFNQDNPIGNDPGTFSPLPDAEITVLGSTDPTKQIAELQNLLDIVRHLANYNGTIFLSTVNGLFKVRTQETVTLLNKILQVMLLSSTFSMQQKNYIRLFMLPFVGTVPSQGQQSQNLGIVFH